MQFGVARTADGTKGVGLMWAVAVAVIAGVFSFGVAWVNRDPYHRLRKALDIHRELPEPYRQAWVKGEVHQAYLKSGTYSGWLWVLWVLVTGVAVSLGVLLVVLSRREGVWTSVEVWALFAAFLAMSTAVGMAFGYAKAGGLSKMKRQELLAKAEEQSS